MNPIFTIMICQSGRMAFHGSFAWHTAEEARDFVFDLVKDGFPGFDSTSEYPIMPIVVEHGDPNRQTGERLIKDAYFFKHKGD